MGEHSIVDSVKAQAELVGYQDPLCKLEGKYFGVKWAVKTDWVQDTESGCVGSFISANRATAAGLLQFIFIFI